MGGMRTGRLAISRGHRAGEVPPPVPRLVLVPRSADVPKPKSRPARPPAAPAVPPSPEYHLTHDRLTALERLARLHKQGMLSAEEFAAEKAVILSLPPDELVLTAPAPGPIPSAGPRASPAGPSLLGRLFGWPLLPVGLVAGIGLSFASQPRETWRFAEDLLRLLGA